MHDEVKPTRMALDRLTHKLSTCKNDEPAGIHCYVAFDQNTHSSYTCNMND